MADKIVEIKVIVREGTKIIQKTITGVQKPLKVNKDG